MRALACALITLAPLPALAADLIRPITVRAFDLQQPGPYEIAVDTKDGATVAFRHDLHVDFAWAPDRAPLARLVTPVIWNGSHEIALKPTGELGQAHLIVFTTDDPQVPRIPLRIKTVANAQYQRYEFYDSNADQRRRTRTVHESFDEYLATMVLRGFGVVESTHEPPPPHGLQLALSSVSLRFGDQVKLVFEAHNTGNTTIALEDIRVSNGSRNHVAFLRLDTTKPATGLAALAPGETVRGYLALADPRSLGRFATIAFLAATGESRTRVIQIWPPRHEPPPKPLPRSVGRLAIGVSGSWGRAQLTGDAGNAEWTPLRAVSANATYGILRWLSVEGALTVWDTDQADIGEATGTSARLAAQVHAGDEWVPFARLGVEPAVFRQQGETRGSLLPTVGIGVHRWFGDQLVATVSASYARETDDLDLAQLALSVAYAWPW